MPFGHDCEFSDWNACLRHFIEEGHSTQSAENICGALKRDTEEGCKESLLDPNNGKLVVKKDFSEEEIAELQRIWKDKYIGGETIF